YPSGVALLAASSPMLPEAPGLLSMMTGAPSPSVSFWPTRRASESVVPPGGNGAIIRTGLPGYAWPVTVPAENRRTTTTANALAFVTISFTVRFRHGSRFTIHHSPFTIHASRVTSHELRVTSYESRKYILARSSHFRIPAGRHHVERKDRARHRIHRRNRR